MTVIKKTKGRPSGSEKDDSKALAAIADAIFANPKSKATTAMRHFRRDASDADIRRWQVKWKDRKDALLAEAAARSQERERKRTARSEGISGGGLSAVQLAAMGGYPDSAITRAIRGLNVSPAMKAIADYQNSPAMRIIREMENNPANRLIREMQDSPVMRMIREQQQMMERITKFGGL